MGLWDKRGLIAVSPPQARRPGTLFGNPAGARSRDLPPFEGLIETPQRTA